MLRIGLNLRNVMRIGVTCLAVSMMFVACGNKSVTDVNIDQTSATLEVGKTITLKATVLPEKAENKTVTWSSDNIAVAKVENGVVTAIKEGKATITVVTVDGLKTASCVITVIPPQGIVMQTTSYREVDFTLAGTGTVTINWGNASETVALSSVPTKFYHDYPIIDSWVIAITGETITHIERLPRLNKLIVNGNTSLKEVNCTGIGLSTTTIDNLFESLHDKPITGGKTIVIIGNPGYYDCDRSIAEKKGWTVR